MKKLPIGIQTFSHLIQQNYVYVDKTEKIHELITTGKYYFFARPPRFGKSLLVCTLESIFLGRKELFEGLAINRLPYDWPEHPVIKLSLADLPVDTPENFIQGLKVIKGLDECLQFVFLTGVSKFSKTSIFAGLNNLRDISMTTRYHDILGYTKNELEHMAFSNYWFATGTPTFLIQLLQLHNYPVQNFERITATEEELEEFEVDDRDPKALLFQTGYLTIKNYDPETRNYTLGYPNKETSDSLTNIEYKDYV
jgi:hypothetical protein